MCLDNYTCIINTLECSDRSDMEREWRTSRLKRMSVSIFLNCISPGAQGSKMSRTGPKGLKVVSNWKFCAEFENQRLTCRTWEFF